MGQPEKKLQTAVLGGGCFWCLDAIYSHVKGVEKVTSGYAGGITVNPDYESVSSGETGHAEVVKIDFDPELIEYEDLLRIFFTIHDPTTLDRQGADIGTQYRSIILYADPFQREVAEKVIQETREENIYEDPIVTAIMPLDQFFPAEEYHQEYFKKNPDSAYCQLVIAPKAAKFRKKFARLYK